MFFSPSQTNAATWVSLASVSSILAISLGVNLKKPFFIVTDSGKVFVPPAKP
jgi:hypothetical protein